MNFYYPYPPYMTKSSSCPYCTPRCPHGYPADTQPYTPWITWQIPMANGTTGTVTNGGTYQFTFTGFKPNAQE